MSVSGKLGLGNIKNQIAHNQFLSALGNKDLKVLQDVITSEKVSMASCVLWAHIHINWLYTALWMHRKILRKSQKPSKAGDGVKAMTWRCVYTFRSTYNSLDNQDVCAVAGSLLHQHAGATATAASYQTKIREQFKRIRTREEELDELRRRRKTLSGKIESAEKKLAKMNSEVWFIMMCCLLAYLATEQEPPTTDSIIGKL